MKKIICSLVCEFKVYVFFENLLLFKLYILFVNSSVSCWVGNSSNNFIVDKESILQSTNLPIGQTNSNRQSNSLSIEESAYRIINVQNVNSLILYFYKKCKDTNCLVSVNTFVVVFLVKKFHLILGRPTPDIIKAYYFDK